MRQWKPMSHHPNIFTYKTKSGTRYGVRRGFKNSEGKRTEFTRSGFLRWRDADKILKTFEAQLISPQRGLLTSSSTTLSQYFDQMIQRKMKFGIWRESTLDTHKRYFDKHIRPVLGSTRIQDIRRDTYQQLIDGLDSEKHLAASTIRTIHRIMMETMNSAENEDVIDKNRLKRVEIHGAEAKPVDIDPAAHEKWMAAAELVLDDYELAMIKVTDLGLRRGEVLGLRTDSIEFSDRDGHEIAGITIDLQRGVEYPLGGPLKTTTSYRTIWVDGDIVPSLHYAILASNNLRKKNGVPDDKTKWLWVNRFGAPASYAFLVERMTKVNEASGIHVRPHMLRHYFATSGLNSAASDVAVMQYLGHKNMQMTADYARPTKIASLNVFENVKKAPQRPSGEKNEKIGGTK